MSHSVAAFHSRGTPGRRVSVCSVKKKDREKKEKCVVFSRVYSTYELYDSSLILKKKKRKATIFLLNL